MIEFIAKFSPRLTAILSLPKEVQDVFVAVEDLIHDRGAGDPKVQAVLNEIRDVRKKLAMIRGD
jgi:hypothetical protein|tara:strand:+ start:425 stop:616 length:192 start_codon:yes stop_codon:yes gene_type:complete